MIGETVPLAFERLYYFERAAQAQLLAMASGEPLRDIAPAVVAATVQQLIEGDRDAVLLTTSRK